MTPGAAPLFGAIELGGTKIICAAGSADAIIGQCRIETGTPAAAITAIGGFFDEVRADFGPLAAVGVASFGPLDLDPTSPTHGALTTTPKLGWRNFGLRAALLARLGTAIAIDTDVNAAALGEAWLGAGRDVESLAYVTVGTGIGVGVATRAGVARGRRHAEAGHLMPRRHPRHDGFAGVCPFHHDCLEGLASGPAIIAAWGGSLATLPADHPAHAVEGDYIGQLCAAITLMLAPDRIVVGGGVMARPALLATVRARTGYWLGNYVEGVSGAEDLDRYIAAPACSDPPGVVGAFLLAQAAMVSGRGLDD